MNDTPKRIAITGGTLWGNRGAEAMLVTTIGYIRRQHPDARFQVFSYYPDQDARLCNDPSIEFLNCRPLNLGLWIFPMAVLTWMFQWIGIRLPDRMVGREVSALRRADLLCDIGGITFCDGREIFLLFNVLSILPAMLLKVPVVKLSQAMGPFQVRINRFFARRVMRRCCHVFARGPVTSRHLTTLPLETGLWSEADDVAFSYEHEFSLSQENDDLVTGFESEYKRRGHQAWRTVAVVPSSLVMRKNPDYIQTLSELVVDLVAAGTYVLLLPNATRQGCDKGRNNDLIAIQEVARNIQANHPETMQHVSLVDFDINTSGIRKLMSHADAVVTSRFHGMVAALADAIPVIVLGWSHKYAEVLARFECELLALDHQASHVDLTSQVLDVLTNHQRHRRQLANCLEGVVERSRYQLDFVNKLLGDVKTVSGSGDDPLKNTVVPTPEYASRH